MEKIWYAVQRDKEDDWGTGSYSKQEAIEMAKKYRDDYPGTLIAVISEGDNPPMTAECIDLITDF